MRRDDFRDFVLEQLDDIRAIDCKALYSGYGLWCDKTFFGIVASGHLYFRVNEDTRADFKTANACPLMTRGGIYEFEFLEVPPSVVKDKEKLVDWATRAVEGARASKGGRRRKVRFR